MKKILKPASMQRAVALAYQQGSRSPRVVAKGQGQIAERIIEKAKGKIRDAKNVVIRGGEPFGEDRLASLHVDDIELRPVKPCTRCQVTTTDQQSGEVSGKEPLRTLATFRRNELLGGVTFGMNTILAGGAGRHLRVGMELQSV